jgi:hypothetical protein
MDEEPGTELTNHSAWPLVNCIADGLKMSQFIRGNIYSSKSSCGMQHRFFTDELKLIL